MWWLTFSDSAKYADTARTWLEGGGFSSHHSFFDPNFLSGPLTLFPAKFLPLTSVYLMVVFKFFPANDQTVIYSGLVLWLLSSILIFLISKGLGSLKSAFVSLAIFITNPQILEFGVNCSSEILFIFLLLLSTWLFLNRKFVPFFCTLPLLLLTRQQSLLLLLTLLITIAWYSKKHLKLITTTAISIVSLSALFSFHVLSPFNNLLPISIDPRYPPGDYLRGRPATQLSPDKLFSKTFYNAYNFVKSPDRIAPSLILVLFFVALATTTPPLQPQVKRFATFTFIALAFLVLAACATIPNSRYIIPLLPFVIVIVSVYLTSKHLRPIITLFILGLTVIPGIGTATLDQRFLSKTTNPSKPPIRFEMSRIMSKYIHPGELTLTNLDAWGAWYFKLTTMWFPLSPNYLTSTHLPKHIVISDYQQHDRDFALGEWSEVVNSPYSISNQLISTYYFVETTFTINSSEVLENIPVKGTILTKK